MQIGDRLKEERERLGFSQADFAAIGGASKRSQIEWEKGKAFPNAAVLAAIAAAGADVQYILTGVRAGYVQAQSQDYAVAEPAADPLAHRKQQIKTLIDQADSAAVWRLWRTSLKKSNESGR